MIGRFPLNINEIVYFGNVINPVGIAYDSIRDRIAVINYGGDLVIFNAADMSIITSVSIEPGIFKGALDFDLVGDRFFLGRDAPPGDIKIIDANTYTVTTIATTYISTQPVFRGFCFDYSNDRFFTSCYGTAGIQPVSKIAIYKLSDFSFINSFDSDKCSGISYDSLNNKLYVAGHSSANIKVYDGSTYTLLNTIPTGGLAYGITQDPDYSDYMVIQNYSLNQLQLFRKSTNSIIGTFSGLTTPRLSIFRNGKIFTTLSTFDKIASIERFYS